MARTQPGSCPTPAPLPPRASAGHLPSPASPLLSPGSASSAAGSIPAGTRSAGTRSATAAVRPHSARRCSGDPAGGHLRAAGTSPGRPRRADWACSGVGRPGAAGDKRMQSRGPAPAVQGRRAQAAALADALASLGRTPARMASLAAYGNDGRWPAPGGRGTVAGGARELSDHPGKLRGWLGGDLEGREGAGCSARRPRARGADALCLQKELVK